LELAEGSFLAMMRPERGAASWCEVKICADESAKIFD
jgi:hypothetical protein